MERVHGWMLAGAAVLGAVGWWLWSVGASAREAAASGARLGEVFGLGERTVGLMGQQVAALVVWGLGGLVLLAVLVGVATRRG